MALLEGVVVTTNQTHIVIKIGCLHCEEPSHFVGFGTKQEAEELAATLNAARPLDELGSFLYVALPIVTPPET